MSIGKRITEWRKARGFTQAKLAQETGLTPSTIAMFENNQRAPDERAVQSLAAALSIPAALLTGPSGTSRTEARPSRVATTLSPSAKPAAPTSSLPGAGVRLSMNRETEVQTTHASPVPNPNLSSFALTAEEAKIILFLRMNPSSMTFMDSYIRADSRQREQLARTWKLIQDLQQHESM